MVRLGDTGVLQSGEPGAHRFVGVASRVQTSTTRREGAAGRVVPRERPAECRKSARVIDARMWTVLMPAIAGSPGSAGRPRGWAGGRRAAKVAKVRRADKKMKCASYGSRGPYRTVGLS